MRGQSASRVHARRSVEKGKYILIVKISVMRGVAMYTAIIDADAYYIVCFSLTLALRCANVSQTSLFDLQASLMILRRANKVAQHQHRLSQSTGRLAT
jgi:hypothetical protein